MIRGLRDAEVELAKRRANRGGGGFRWVFGLAFQVRADRPDFLYIAGS